MCKVPLANPSFLYNSGETFISAGSCPINGHFVDLKVGISSKGRASSVAFITVAVDCRRHLGMAAPNLEADLSVAILGQ